MPSSPTCPVCDRTVEERDSNDTFPFCSKRCKRVDLSRWFDESYTISMTPHSTERSLPADGTADDSED